MKPAEIVSERRKTRYPLVLVHGVGFRDRRHINYWGRIPRILIQNGAVVYYCGQDAWGTVERNAEDVKRCVLDALAETGAEKANILAHSKGGLEARYAISRLGLGEKVASLTTISTPHLGSKTMDYICTWPRFLLFFAGFLVNGFYKLLGDANPDFYSVAQSLTTAACARFNAETPDMDGIYYQSYASRMKNALGDVLLLIPYLVVKRFDGDNDGIVGLSSAQWGAYRGEMEGRGRRGVSHGDVVNMRRISINSADIRETFVRIVEELKEMGF